MKFSDISKKIIKPIVFILLLIVLVLIVQSRAFKINDSRSYQTFKGFYAEPSNSLDMVYIGQSNVYPFWNAPLCWREYGFTTYPLAIGAMPCRSTKYIIEEARKTQPDALYLINLNSFLDVDYDVSHVHNVVDYMKSSSTKNALLKDLLENLNEEYDKLEFIFPIVRFHPGWNEITEITMEYGSNGLKGGSIYTNYLETIEDVSNKLRLTENRVKLPESQIEILDDLMEYIKNNGVEVLFVVVPQSLQDESLVGELNYAVDFVKEKGFDVMDMEHSMEEIGLDLKTDFYNAQHLNVHGSIKFTHYLSEYLKENYDFKDKREEAGYDSWHTALENYKEVIAPYVPEFELNTASRDLSIEAPEPETLIATGQSFYLSWKQLEDAPAGYEIYRRFYGTELDGIQEKPTPWEKVGEVDGKINAFVDDSPLELLGKYSYTVVAYNKSGEEKVYGSYSYTGIQGVTRINPPEITSFEHSADGNTITWNPVEGVDGYAVVRRIDGQTFVNIAELPANTLSYTDALYQEGVDYTYSVSGYIDLGQGEGDRRYGYYDQKGPRFGPNADTEGGGA